MSGHRTTAPPPALAVLLFRDALSRANHLIDEARTLADYEYRSPTPPRVATLIQGIVTRGQQSIRDEWCEYQKVTSDEDRARILRNVQVWDSVLRTTGSRLRYIIGASASRVPGGLGLLLETIIQEQGLGDGILLREKWTYNYAVDISPIEQSYRDALGGELDSDQFISLFGSEGSYRNTFAIGFPAIERNNALLHCAIGHELGHIAVERWLTHNYDSDPRVALESRDAATRLSSQPSDGEFELDEWVEIMAATERIRTARRRFLQEYGSDLYAIELFGPAALLSMTSIAMSQELDKEPLIQTDYYPSWRSRLRFALDWLNRDTPDSWISRPTSKNEWAESLASHLHHLDRFLGSAPAVGNPEMAEADRLAKQTLASMGPTIAFDVRATAGSRKQAMDQAYILADRISRLTPPNDIGSDQRQPEYPMLWAILNAGWLYTIRENEKSNHELVRGGASEGVVNRLILKALGDVIVMRDFRRFLEQGEPA
jgi:hypothetical protein